MEDAGLGNSLETDDQTTGSSSKRVPAVRRAAAILWELSERSTPMNLSQISRAVGIIPSTCLHILRELVVARLIAYDASAKTYQLGAGLLELANSASGLNTFADQAKPRLQALANRFDMTATATSRIDDRHLALVAFANPPKSISLRVTVGGRVPLLSGASGRVLAAFGRMSEDQMRLNLAKVKWVRPIEFEAWLEQVEKTRQDGYAEDLEGFSEGVSTIQVPIFDPDGGVSHTIGVLGISAQITEENRDEIVAELKQASSQISAGIR